MSTSILLSKIIGPLFIVLAMSLIINASVFKNLFKNLGKETFLLFLSGFISFIIGMFMIIYHNIWELNGFLIITILGYIVVIKGISLIIFPNSSINFTKKVILTKNLIKIIGIVYFIIGLYITYLGYFN